MSIFLYIFYILYTDKQFFIQYTKKKKKINIIFLIIVQKKKKHK